LIAAVDVVIPGGQPHIDALHDGVRGACAISAKSAYRAAAWRAPST